MSIFKEIDKKEFDLFFSTFHKWFEPLVYPEYTGLPDEEYIFPYRKSNGLGSGCGLGDGYGDGRGYGYGYGSGCGLGDGYGDGSGYGLGHGYGDGDDG